MEPQTPQKGKPDDRAQQTPNKPNLISWETAWEERTPAAKKALLAQTQDQIHDLIDDPDLESESRYANLILLNRTIHMAARYAGIDPVIFRDPKLTPAQSRAKVHFEPDSDGDDEMDEQDEVLDDDEETDVASLERASRTLSLRSNRRRPQHDATQGDSRATGDDNTAAPAGSAADPISQDVPPCAAIQALPSLGLVDGDGRTPATALIMGAKKLRRAPGLVVASWPIQEGGASLSQLAVEVHEHIRQHTFEGLVNQATRYQRVHPWAATQFLSFILGDTFGQNGIARLNNLLQAATAPASEPNSVSQGDVRAAELKCLEPGLPVIEQQFWSTFAAVLVQETPARNAYRDFIKLWQRLSFINAFQSLKTQVDDYPNSQLAVKMHRARASGRGVGDVSKVIDYVAQELNQKRDWVTARLRQHDPVARMCEAFTPGVLVLVDGSKFSTVSGTESGRIFTEMLAIINEDMPELREACVLLEDRVVKPLLNNAADDFARLANVKIAVGTRAGALMTRIRAIPEPQIQY